MMIQISQRYIVFFKSKNEYYYQDILISVSSVITPLITMFVWPSYSAYSGGSPCSHS